jgi:hypothetical protein
VFIESSLIKGRNSCIQDSKILFKQFFFFFLKKKKKPFQVACIGGISHQSVMEKISTLVKKKKKKKLKHKCHEIKRNYAMKNIKFPIQTKLYWLRVLLKMKTK